MDNSFEIMGTGFDTRAIQAGQNFNEWGHLGNHKSIGR